MNGNLALKKNDTYKEGNILIPEEYISGILRYREKKPKSVNDGILASVLRRSFDNDLNDRETLLEIMAKVVDVYGETIDNGIKNSNQGKLCNNCCEELEDTISDLEDTIELLEAEWTIDNITLNDKIINLKIIEGKLESEVVALNKRLQKRL